jgi:hypothetical protein
VNYGFGKQNVQLPAIFVLGFEEESLVTLLPVLDQLNKTAFAGELNFINGSNILHRKDLLFSSLSKIRSQVLHYNNNQIRALHLANTILCDTVQTVNSDCGFETLSEIAHAFVSFAMSGVVALDAKNAHSVADCVNGSS